MSELIRHLPTSGTVSPAEAIDFSGPRLRYGDDRARDFWAAVSEQLLTDRVRRRHPELISLGFFLRPASLTELLDSVHDAPDDVRTPYGVVLQVAPANVDSLFAYSWALSMLAGNANLIRVSQRAGAAARLIIEIAAAAFADADPLVRATQRVVSYPAEPAVTDVLSAGCDLRVIWGGDDAIAEIRRSPVRPWARELTFPDRTSSTVLSAAGWASADDRSRAGLAERFYSDAYWYDQAACSSPQTLFWVGGPGAVERAQAEFSAVLAAEVDRRRPRVAAEMGVHARTAVYGLAAAGAATRLDFERPQLTWVELAEADRAPYRWLGIGVFPYARLDRLTDLAGLLDRRQQTLAHFGFAADELAEFAEVLPPRTVDRIVPVGSALDFARTWDGYELLREFSMVRTVIA